MLTSPTRPTPKQLSLARLLLLTPLILIGLPPVRALLGLTSSVEEGGGALASLLSPRVAFLAMALSFVMGLWSALKLKAAEREGSEVSPPLTRLTDLPLIYVALWASAPLIPEWILISKAALDTLTLGLSALGRGPKRRSMITTLSETTLFALVSLNLGLGGRLITADNVGLLLMLHLVYSALVLAYQVRLLQKRFIADALSFSNLLCGLASVHTSSLGEYESSLMFLLLGAAFDGFDGAAARKFGGTKWGVYSDDVADGVNYGIAPGFALYYLLGGVEGVVIGSFYATFTISRLIYFTLNKDASDPNYFAGIPSPVGGMIVMSSVVLFRDQPTWVGFLAGVACTQMVAFSTNYRHLGRALTSSRRALFGAPAYLLIFVLGTALWGVKGAAAVVLAGAATYGFLPSLLSFKALFSEEDMKEKDA